MLGIHKRYKRQPLPSVHNKPHRIMCSSIVTANHHACAIAVEAAHQASIMMSTKSSVFDPEREMKIPRFSIEEVVLGNLLGRGGFSNVYEVQKLEPARNNISEKKSSESERVMFQYTARKFLSEHCIRKKTDMPRYAIKLLSPRTMANSESFQMAAADLITESKFLASLEHPNIIKIRGISDEGVYGFASGLEGGFFILLDHLQDALDRRIVAWNARKRKICCSLNINFWNGTKKQRSLLVERLQCALDVSAALAYLHSRSIIFRDLKPANIGFDCRGDAKIFDFGLARELHPDDLLDDDLYRLTGYTGSPRYMAPEVAKYLPYNLTADVYSFSILLWQLCSLKNPYRKMNARNHSNRVVYGSLRPSISNFWSKPLCSLMKKGWNKNISERPDMGSCSNIIRQELRDLSNGDMRSLETKRRRSTYVLEHPVMDSITENSCSLGCIRAKAA